MSVAPALPGEDHESWHRRWKGGKIPWHQSSVNRTLEVRMDTRSIELETRQSCGSTYTHVIIILINVAYKLSLARGTTHINGQHAF